MRLGHLAAAASALMLVAAPVAASANPASKLSVASSARAGSDMKKSSAQAGGFPFLIVFVVIAAGLGLYFAVDGGSDDDALPTSP